MAEFVRGAKVRPPLLTPEVDPPLTMIEASFVMCDVAKRHGVKTLDEFLTYMARAWKAHALCPAPGKSEKS